MEKIYLIKYKNYNIIFRILYFILTLGISELLFFNFKYLKKYFLFNISSLKNSDFIYIFKNIRKKPLNYLIKIQKYIIKDENYYYFKRMNIIYKINSKDNYSRVRSPFKNLHLKEIYKKIDELKLLDKDFIKNIYGTPYLDTNNKNILFIFFSEINQWFYYFQLFAIIVWFLLENLELAIILLVLTFISLILSSYQIKKNLNSIDKLSNHIDNYKIIDNNIKKKIDSNDIVIGDIIEINNKMILPCDIILLKGICLVNESNLTGESQLNLKINLENGKNIKKQNILYSGSIVKSVYNNEDCYGCVYKNGFNTKKGKIINSILFQKDYNKSLITESYKFLLIILVINCISMVYYIVFIIYYDNTGSFTTYKYILRVWEIFIITLPPTLPLFLNETIRFSKIKLEKLKITCINISKIILSSNLDIICFDKTGTLTSEELELKSIYFNHTDILELNNKNNNDLFYNSKLINKDQIIFLNISLGVNNNWYLDENNNLNGLSIDKILYKSSKLNIIENKPNYTLYKFNSSNNVINFEKIEKIKIFEFHSKLKKMGVICKIDNKYYLFVKGSYESLINCCVKNSINEEINIDYNSISKSGLRGILLAYKEINWDDIKNNFENLDNNLIFLGLVFFRNLLKYNTKKILTNLNLNSIDNLMITGDSIFTAINIAIQSGIINKELVYYCNSSDINNNEWVNYSNINDILTTSELIKLLNNNRICLAINSIIFNYLIKSDIYNKKIIFKNIKVYARMTPIDKELVILNYKSLFRVNIGYCGDGANDCLALKAADIGLCIGKSSSNLSSPFTYSEQNIDGIISLIIIGRNCLETCIQIFQFLIYFSLIQFIGIIILYTFSLDYSNGMYLYMDILLYIILPIGIILKDSNNNITNNKPKITLFNNRILINFMINILLILASNIIITLMFNNNDTIKTFIFYNAIFLILIISQVLIRNKPYRSSYKIISFNTIFMILFFIINCLLIFQAFRFYLENFYLYMEISIVKNSDLLNLVIIIISEAILIGVSNIFVNKYYVN